MDRTRSCILVVEHAFRPLLEVRQALVGQGHEVCTAAMSTAAAEASAVRPTLILLATECPDDGRQAYEAIRSHDALQHIPIVCVVPRGDEAFLAAALAAGIDDCISWPATAAEFRARIETHVQVARLQEELADTRRELTEEVSRRVQLATRLARLTAAEIRPWDAADFVGQSPTLQPALEAVGRLRQLTIPVLITGESGTGKELIARALHYGGAGDEGPYVPVNCSAIPAELAESLFFGHVRGAFSGADSDRPGFFELAHGGTLFLDEIGDMPLGLQAKLLRVLEEGKVLPVGAQTEKPVNVRVVTATNIDLQEYIRAGRFREDLYFRLARYPIRVPSLRERHEDIPLLARHFVQALAEESGIEAQELSAEVLQMLSGYDYPGNVRELRSVVERAVIESDGGAIRPQHVHLEFDVTPTRETHATKQPVLGTDDVPLNFDEAELMLIQRALRIAGGNITRAARLMGINRTKIYRKLASAEAPESPDV